MMDGRRARVATIIAMAVHISRVVAIVQMLVRSPPKLRLNA
jgi:hypothetical protein